MLSEADGYALLRQYDVPAPAFEIVQSADDAAKAAASIGYPVVMKIVSPQIIHKSDAGGVIVGVKDDAAAKEAFDKIVANAKNYDASAEIKGVIVEEMAKPGLELIAGGLDTSFTVMYLAKEKGYDVYAACANTGGFSEEQLKQNEENAYKLGAVKYVTLDVTKEYYDKSLKFMVFGNVLRNGTYPISVSSERIFQGMAIARYANEIGADAIAHGSTGAGNDQVRFDMTFLVMSPNVEIITLTRDMALTRQYEIDYLNQHGFAADWTKLKYSYNVGIWGTSICGGEILDSREGLPETAYLKQVTKTGSERLKIGFKKGEICSVNGKEYTDKIAAIQEIEKIACAYGIGRDMHVGDTIIGIKGRVGFEAAAPMVIIGAHKFLEKYTLSKWQQYWKDQVANWYGMFLHESQYLEPVMRDIEAMLQESQRHVNGEVILELRPYTFSTVGVDSKDDLVKTKFGEYGEMNKGWTSEDAKGFIKVTSVPLRVFYTNHPDDAKDI
jgi:argininosuccinate synthase